MKDMETTAAIYLRKSTEDDGKSVVAQERQLRTKAEQLGIDTATLLFYLFRLEVHGLQQLRRTLGQSTPVDVITIRRSSTMVAEEVEAVAAVEEVEVDEVAELSEVVAVEEVAKAVVFEAVKAVEAVEEVFFCSGL